MLITFLEHYLCFGTMEEYEEKTQILVKLSVLEERIENGFTGVNRRLDTTNGRLGKHEGRLDILERAHIEQPKRFDYKLILIGVLIGGFLVSAGMNLREVLQIVP